MNKVRSERAASRRLSASRKAHTVEAEREQAGILSDGTAIDSITLTTPAGISATILTYGATLQSFRAPDRAGRIADITLGYDAAAAYEAHPNYLGVTIGRYANRIAGGRFELDGQGFTLPRNDGPNVLHGGPRGFDKRLWTIASVRSGPVASVTLTLTSADGDQGFPGRLEVSTTYSLTANGELEISFAAISDAPTVVNMTNHALFNLGGEGGSASATDHLLTIPASRYTPVDAALIPTGELRSVAGSVFDFTNGRRIADGLRDGNERQIVLARGYDHNFALDKGLTDAPQLAASLADPVSGRLLEVLSTEPGIQVYSGNSLDGSIVGRGGRLYRMGDGIALEPQKFPDTPNRPEFPSARLEPGETYRHRMIYRVGLMAENEFD